MNLTDTTFQPLLAAARNHGEPPIINVGVGEDLTIRDLAELISEVISYSGELRFDCSKPDGTMRKLMDVSRLNGLGWKATTDLKSGIEQAYSNFLGANVKL